MLFRSHPACLKESTYQILSQRGWVSGHDPTPEELSAMVSSLPKPAVAPEDQTQSDTEPSTEDNSATAEDTSSNTTTTQSFKVELRESMDMGAN